MKRPTFDEPKKSASNKRPYDITDEETDTEMSRQVKNHFKQRSLEKKVPIDPTTKAFFQKMSEPTRARIVSDYDRSIRKSYEKTKRKSKVFPPSSVCKENKRVDPMPSEHDCNIEQYMADTNLTKEQLLGIAPIKKKSVADIYHKFNLGEPLIKPELVKKLSTLTYLHRCTDSINDTWNNQPMHGLKTNITFVGCAIYG